jgi:hypothetical protein
MIAITAAYVINILLLIRLGKTIDVSDANDRTPSIRNREQ